MKIKIKKKKLTGYAAYKYEQTKRRTAKRKHALKSPTLIEKAFKELRS